MQKKILQLYRRSPAGKAMLTIPRVAYRAVIDSILPDEAWCSHIFALTQDYPLSLDNPRTLCEKMQWLKLYNRHPGFTNWADKYKVRDYIRDMLGEKYLVPLLAVCDEPQKNDFAALDAPFIIKPNHSSGKYFIVRDKKEMDWDLVVKQCRRWLKTNLYREGREMQYRDIPPLIIVEKLLLDENGNIPSDYRCHCFHGKVALIQVNQKKGKDFKKSFYDTNWHRQHLTWSVCVGNKPLWPDGGDIDKPAVLDELIAISEKLARRFLLIRLDWYIVANRIYFGEATFHHGGGFERIQPYEWDLRLGDMLHLPDKSSIREYADKLLRELT